MNMDNETIVCCKCKTALSTPYYFRVTRQKKSYYCKTCLTHKFEKRYRYMDINGVQKLMDAHYTLVKS